MPPFDGRKRTMHKNFGIFFVALMAMAACGDSDGSGGTGAAGGSGGEPSAGAPAGGEGGAPAATVNGCTFETAEAAPAGPVDLAWALSHQECLIVEVGTTVTWTGDFGFHPLAGGETGTADAASAITTSDQTGASASVTFDVAGDFPYFCEVHLSSMQGVIYVR
jgi:plastocyanin